MEWTRPSGRRARPGRGCALFFALATVLTGPPAAAEEARPAGESSDLTRPAPGAPAPEGLSAHPGTAAPEQTPPPGGASTGPSAAPPAGPAANGAGTPGEPAPDRDVFESQAAFGPADAPGGAGAPAAAAGDDHLPGVFAVVGWTVVVLAAMAACLGLLKRVTHGRGGFAGGQAIRILGRRVLDAHTTLYLVEFGRTVVRLGVTRGTVTLLGEITDPDEAAWLRTLAPGSRSESVVGAFQSALNEHLETGAAVPAWTEPSPGEALGGLRGEIQKMSETVRSWKSGWVGGAAGGGAGQGT